MDLQFLKSNRFWALFTGAVVFYLKTKGYIGEAEMMMIETVLAGFIAVRSVDRASEFIGGARKDV